MGLYRGLKLKTAGSIWDVEVVECSPFDLPKYSQRPMIINVGLPANTSRNDDLCREHGWQPGVCHSVVLLGYRDPMHARIADPTPSVGHEVWHAATLNRLWQGRALRLVERYPQNKMLASR